MRLNKNTLIDLVFVFFFLFNLLFNDYSDSHVLIPAVLLFFHVQKIWQFRNSAELEFLLVFSITFSIYWLLSVFLDVDIHYLASNIKNYHMAKAFAAQGLFLSCIFLILKGRAPCTIADYPRRNITAIFWFCILAMGLCLIGGISTAEGSILDQSYDFSVDKSSVLFEYVLLLIIFGYMSSGNSRTRKVVLIIASACFVLAPLYFSRRLPATMVLFAMLLLFWRPSGLKQVLAIFVAGFFALSLLALFRVGESGQSFVGILLNIGDQGAMRNNQGGSIYSAAVYMRLIEDGIFDFSFAIKSMASLLLSIFLPSSMVDEAAYINLAAVNYIPIPGNGGMPGVAFYVFGRVFGVVLAGLVIGRLLVLSRRSYMAAVYVTFIFFTFPRWMAYNVNIMFKAGILLMIGYLVIEFLTSSYRKSARLSSGSWEEEVIEAKA
ncbi:hypothetical protein [Variovorax paradoxus]|uniref:Oligosaccharide repeat unit polymerase n=1 Tax=Variovorax paradoxus TaxID=34073 RepID=A0A0H2M201_VARPD|nr:hypothetical protein [Variovorax paradoxus]KLN56434.1 hypothetical protein VPARA_23760 [Variovorax paradoxus]